MVESEKLMPVNCAWCKREIYKGPPVDGRGPSDGGCLVCTEMASVDSLYDLTDPEIMEQALKNARDRLEMAKTDHFEGYEKLLEEDERAYRVEGKLFAYHDKMGITREKDDEPAKPLEMGMR